MSTLLVIKIVLAAGAVAVLIGAILRRRRSGQTPSPEVMQALRLTALEWVPDGLDDFGADEPVGILMDLGISGATASVFAGLRGDASIYLSSGGGVIGGFAHEKVRLAAIEFVREAATHRDQMEPATDYPYPADEHVRFYLRTPAAVYATSERSENALREKQDPLWPLYYSGHSVITELYAIAGDRV